MTHAPPSMLAAASIDAIPLAPPHRRVHRHDPRRLTSPRRSTHAPCSIASLRARARPVHVLLCARAPILLALALRARPLPGDAPIAIAGAAPHAAPLALIRPLHVDAAGADATADTPGARSAITLVVSR